MTFTTGGDAAPPSELFRRLTEAVTAFAEAVEDLLGSEFTHPFTIGSDALRDCAADEEHQGTRSKTPLTNLATAQTGAGLLQSDMLRGMAAALPAPAVFFSPYPLARTCIVVAAKAWYVLTADSREQRLQRHLNEELAGLYDAPILDDEKARTYLNEKTADYVAIGATAGLRVRQKKNPKPWEAPFLLHPDEPETEMPISETELVRLIVQASGFAESYAGTPYKVLSGAAHGRFHRAGLMSYAPVGPSQGSVQLAAVHSKVHVIATVTIHAAFATLTYLLALARYAKVPEELVRERLHGSMSEWNVVAQSG